MSLEKKWREEHMKRTIKKQFWFNRSESQDLQKKAKKACLTEAGLIRFLIKGYEPREQPSENFYDAMNEMREIGNNIEKIVARADKLEFTDSQMLRSEAKRWHKFQADVERKFIRPEKSDLRWQ